MSELRYVVGLQSCLELIKKNPKSIRQIYLRPNWNKNSDLKKIHHFAKQNKISFQELAFSKLSSIADSHQGLCLVAEGRPQVSFKNLQKNEKQIAIYLDQIEDPRNLGAVIRTAWLMGVEAIFLPTKGSAKLTPTVYKVACGGAEYVPLEFVSSPIQLIERLKKFGFCTYGLHFCKNSSSVFNFSFDKKTLICVGSEGRGLQTSVQKLCQNLLYIPQKDSRASYNLSVATAICLSECIRS